jgi:sugar lactone lactonase YvrE
MEEPLYGLLNHCTAKILIPESDGLGSGFFVAPGLLLTCEHVVRSARSSLEKIEVYWDRKPDQALNERTDTDADWCKKPYQVLKMETDADSDLALLQVNITDHPCVFLSKESPLPFDNLYSYGFPDINPFGDPATFQLEGKDGSQQERLTFKAGLVRPGQSGSPLLNINSGYVCGVVHVSRGRGGKFGGRAIPGPSIFQAFPEIETQQQLFHRKDQRWMDCLWENTALPKEDPRLRLLQNVRVFRIKKIFEEHLGQTAYILLGLSELPEAIENPLRPPKQEADRPEHGLSLHTTITRVYDQSIEGSLLILGEPGGGKTTMLLELARNLLERARLNNKHPIPVVFNLSSWAAKQQPLADWLIEELCRLYRMSRTQSKSWIESDEVLPLLDGLDEVRQNALPACVKAINTYRQEHNSLPTVVCCNKNAYFSQSARLHMRGAVVVQSLTTEQIDECLEGTEPQLERLRRVRFNDPVMQKLLTTPLMLNILMAIFRDMPPDEDLLTSGSLEGQRQQILAKYVQRMFKDQIAHSRYTSTQANHWLSYLAKQLYQEGPKEFSVENLQPGWLRNANKYLYYVYNWCIGSSYGLVFGLPVIWFAGFFQPSSFVTWLVLGFVCGVLYPIRSIRIQPAEAITWSWEGLISGLVIGMAVGIVIGWISALGAALAGVVGSGLSTGPTAGAFFGIIFGTIFGVFRGLFPKQLIIRTNRLPNIGIRRSLKNGLVFGLLCPIMGMVVGMVVGLVLWLHEYYPDYAQDYGPKDFLVIGLVIGLAVGLYIGLVFGMFKGLGAFVQHYLLRFFLWSTNGLPWNLVHFLDEAARRHLLSKVGSNYVFWHESLLEYFVTFDELASTTPKKASIFHRKPKLSLMGRLFTGPLPRPASRIRLAWQIILRVMLALLIIGTFGTVFVSWSLAQISSTSLPDPVTLTPSVGTIESSPQVTINSTDFRGTISEFSPLPLGNPIEGMVIGPDGNLWFTDTSLSASGSRLIGLITPSGRITEFVLTDEAAGEITAGSDGNLWFAETDHVGRITPSGKITEFVLPTGDQETDGQAGEITEGSDGNLWFTEGGVDKIGRITPTGKITEFTLPTKLGNGSGPDGITAGSDGNLWFTVGDKIGRITPIGKITEFTLPTKLGNGSGPDGITAGPDGNLWFIEVYGNAIGRITLTGKITEFALPPDQIPGEITAGPDGNLWFPLGGQIGRITPTGKITEFTLPSDYEGDQGSTLGIGDILFGPGAHLWFADGNNSAIGYMTSAQFNTRTKR